MNVYIASYIFFSTASTNTVGQTKQDASDKKKPEPVQEKNPEPVKEVRLVATKL